MLKQITDNEYEPTAKYKRRHQGRPVLLAVARFTWALGLTMLLVVARFPWAW
jgi:hypothetical protein